MGMLSDKFGRKVCFLLTILASAVSLLLSGLSTNVWQVLLVRGVCGLMGSTIPLAQAIVNDVIKDPTLNPKYIGFVGACLGVGITIGSGIGAALPNLAVVLNIPESYKYPFVLCLASAVNLVSLIYSILNLQEPSARGVWYADHYGQDSRYNRMDTENKMDSNENDTSSPTKDNNNIWKVYITSLIAVFFKWGFTTFISSRF